MLSTYNHALFDVIHLPQVSERADHSVQLYIYDCKSQRGLSELDMFYDKSHNDQMLATRSLLLTLLLRDLQLSRLPYFGALSIWSSEKAP